MPKRLILVNGVLAIILTLSAVYIVRQFMSPMPLPAMPRNRPAPAGPEIPRASTDRPPAVAYSVVTARNLFSPTRTETPPAPVVAGPVVPLVKPNLFGVVLREGAPIAYLEDPTTKRVAGYRVGDAIIGGTVKTINADAVVIARPEGQVDIRLHEPTRPRAAGGGPQLPGAPTPGPAAQPSAPLPGVIPPTAQAEGAPPASVVPAPGAPPAAAAAPGTPAPAPVVPGRRTLPPNLLRRVPQVPPADAPQQ
jgi:hypothetical protein